MGEKALCPGILRCLQSALQNLLSKFAQPTRLKLLEQALEAFHALPIQKDEPPPLPASMRTLGFFGPGIITGELNHVSMHTL